MEDEIWKEIRSFPNYEVSSFGRIRSLQKIHPRILVQRLNKVGYPIINLYRNGRSHQLTVNKLVLEAFEGPRPFGYETHHIDEIKQNNHISNLKWVEKRNHKRKYHLKIQPTLLGEPRSLNLQCYSSPCP